jgi:mRNA deadenylase 3'-5' endonuclease subunit Ccr4
MGQTMTWDRPIDDENLQNKGLSPSEASEVSVLSFNILADQYSSYQDFCPKVYLDFKYRASLIFSILRANQCDFLCLQEVDTYESHFKSFLENEGYSSQYKKRPSGYNNDGSLIAWKSDRWVVLEIKIIDYNEHPKCKENSAYRKNNVGLVIAFQEKSSNRRIIVGTSHFFWNPTYEYVKFLQGKIYSDVCKEFKDKYQCPVVLTGDLNSEPSSFTIKYLLGEELGIQPGDDTSNEILTMADINPLELQSAYSSYFQGSHPEFTNYTRDFKACIDYILHSPELKVKELGSLPSSEDLRGIIGNPSEKYPSDHLPLSAKFEFN